MNTEKNKLIVEFMGYEYSKYEYLRVVSMFELDNALENDTNETLNFHSDWNWLMLVVKKIESFEDENRCSKFNVIIEQTFVEIIENHTGEEIVNLDRNTKIEAIFDACVDFIKWFNQLQEQGKILFEKHFEQAKKEILADIESGKIPATVKSYFELNEYVDANAYGGFCEEGYVISENFELERKVQDAIEEWLKARK